MTYRKHMNNPFPAIRNITLTLLLLLAPAAGGQKVSLKTNLVKDATGTVNLGAELGLAPHWSLDVSGDVNTWSTSGARKWKHWKVQPELRRWMCEKGNGFFLAAHAQGGQFNLGRLSHGFKLPGTDLRKLKDGRYQGWFVGAGLGAGYAWMLSRHWNVEGELGVGYAYSSSDRYNCKGCGRKTDSNIKHHYVGPTKVALNLVYLF